MAKHTEEKAKEVQKEAPPTEPPPETNDDGNIVIRGEGPLLDSSGNRGLGPITGFITPEQYKAEQAAAKAVKAE